MVSTRFCFIILVVALSYAHSQEGKAVEYTPVEKYAMIGSDILFTPEQEASLRSRSAYLRAKKWPNAIIPYIVDAGFSKIPSRMAALKQAIQDYKDNTCIKLVERKTEKDYVKFYNGTGCSSYIGMIGGEQNISYGDGCDTTRGTPVHEIMHCLGFMHEHQRPDRDDYVVIKLENVLSGTERNFQKIATAETNTLNTKYDLTSVMHYPRWAFSPSINLNTIETKDISQMDKIGQRNFFSACDLARINKLYECGSTFKTTC